MVLVEELEGLIESKTPVYLINEYTGLLESYVMEDWEYDSHYRAYANIRGIGETHGSCCEYVDLLYKSSQECLESQEIREKDLAEQYRKGISSVEGLVVFMYQGDFRSDSVDAMVRRTVIKEKAKEFGIELG